jgi:hypothetical protein
MARTPLAQTIRVKTFERAAFHSLTQARYCRARGYIAEQMLHVREARVWWRWARETARQAQ